VRIIVGFAAGGGNDIIARLIAQWLTERLGQSFVVDNRPGGGSNIGTEAVVNAPPDGCTLLLVSAANAINASMFDKLNFNFIHDIGAVGGLISVPSVILLHPSSQVRTVPEFIAYAKQNAGKLSMASGGTATTTHLAGELLKMMAGIDMIHVPYRGTGPAITDLLGGQVQVMFGSAPSSVQYIKTGQLRGLAVTSSERLETLPDMPTLRDRARLRGVAMVRNRRAQGDAGADHRRAQHGNQCFSGRPEDEGQACRSRRNRAAGLGRRVHENDRRRNREVEQGGQVRQSQAIGQPGGTGRQAAFDPSKVQTCYGVQRNRGHLKNGNTNLLGIEKFCKIFFFI
jgi:hypothetical protein